jgi:hypothetical protein
MRFQTNLSAFLVFLTCSLACGQGKGPASIDVPIGRVATIPIQVNGEEFQYDVLGGDVFDAWREFSAPNELRIKALGHANGTGYIVVSSVKAGKLQPLFTVRVVVGAGPGPAPVPPIPPGPNPVPPGPLDPLASAIKAAAAADGFLKLKDLAMGFRTCGALIERASTVAELQASTTAALLSAVGDMKGKAPRLRVILAKELDTLPEAGALTPDIKARASAIFTTLANACEGASK